MKNRAIKKTDYAAHICNYELNVTFRKTRTIETATSVEQYFAAIIETWPAKYETLL